MFMLAGGFNESFEDIFKCIQQVSLSDPYSEDVFGRTISHNDGWGYVSFVDNAVTHFKTLTPVFDSTAPIIKGHAIMLHVRKSGKTGPFGMVNAHPYYRTTTTHEIYLSHNGFLGKDEMGSVFGQPYMDQHSDSEIFLDKLAGYRNDIVSNIKESIDYVYEKKAMKGGFNLLILSVERSTGKIQMFAYTDAANYKLYHELYYINFGKYSGIFSSSILTSKHFPDYKEKFVLKRKVLYKMTEDNITEL